MSKDHLPLRELERLSAYLDGELRAHDARQLEVRLEREPALRKAYEELRTVAKSLRGLPQVEPPRSFILSHELVGVPQRRSSYPVLRLATTLAAFAFIALVGVDAVTTNFGGTRSSQSMDQVVAELPALAESEALGAAKIEALEPEAALESQPAEMLAGAEALAETVEGEALAMAPEPEQTSDAVVQEEGRAAEGERATEPEADAVPALESPQEDTAGTLSATEYPAQDLMENQLELSGDNDQVMTFAQPESGLSLRSTNPWLRGVEIGLGGLALLLGALTVWARKRPI